MDDPTCEPATRLETIEFSADHLELVSDFDCGPEPWQQERVEWIRNAPPFEGALLAMRKYGTTVWLHRIHIPLQESPFVFGYSSLGHSKMPHPFPDGERRRIQYIPGLALAEQCQGKTYEGKRYSRIIMDHILDEAAKREPDLIGLHVYAKNEKAIRLYKSYGFKITGGPDKNDLLGMWRWPPKLEAADETPTAS